MNEQFTHEQLMTDEGYRLAYGRVQIFDQYEASEYDNRDAWIRVQGRRKEAEKELLVVAEQATLRLQLTAANARAAAETQKRQELTVEVNDVSQQRAMLRHVLGDLVAEITVWADENSAELNLVSPEERQRLHEVLERASSIVQHAYDDTLTHDVYVKAGYVVYSE